MNANPLIIAEAGVNHNGDLGRALEMVDAAAEAGTQIVKFQAFKTEDLIATGTPTALYQQQNTGSSDQAKMIEKLELSAKDFEKIATRCAERNIEFLVTIFDTGLTRHFLNIGLQRIKVASGELTNDPALKDFAKLGLPIIISTGMATDDEVDWAVRILRENGATDITVLQCTSIYPAPPASANLAAMVAMGKRHSAPFGYSDHTLGDHVAIAAVALGATVIEKHFTLDRKLPGPDHVASLEPDELATMVRKLRETHASLGQATKQPLKEERATAALVRRSWHAARDLAAGQILSQDDIMLIRPASGLPPRENPIGCKLQENVNAFAPITSSDIG